MKNNKIEAKSIQKRIIETFLIIFILISNILALTLYFYYKSNLNRTKELSYLNDIHSLRAEMFEFSEKKQILGYLEIKEVKHLIII